jgi:hypothetical protein
MNSKGITAGLMLAWANGVPSWESFSSDTARLRYARYAVARYSAYNLVFIVSGEWDESGTKDMYLAIGNEIKSNDPHHRMIAIHSTGSVEEFATETWMSFGDYQQLYTSLHANILNARDHNKPVVNSEYAYYLRDQDGDGIVDKPNSATLIDIRNATYDIIMAGGYFVTGWGTTYMGGSRDPGPFNPDDPRNDEWEEDVQHIRTLFTGLKWWKLRPNDGLLSGPGIHYCLAEIGKQYLAYVRDSSGAISLSLGGAAAATYSVRRFDPRTGAYSFLFNYSGSGPVTLSPPDSQDWVFVLVKTATTDFDGDGNTDILWHHATQGLTAMWLMNGTTISSSAYLPTLSDTNWQIVGVGDFNGDTKADILWHHATQGLTAMWLMNGTTISSSAYLPTLSDTNWQIQ